MNAEQPQATRDIKITLDLPDAVKNKVYAKINLAITSDYALQEFITEFTANFTRTLNEANYSVAVFDTSCYLMNDMIGKVSWMHSPDTNEYRRLMNLKTVIYTLQWELKK